MLSIFNHVRDRSNPRTHSSFPVVKKTIERNLREIQYYWRNMNWSVKSEHILVGLLQSIRSETNNTADTYRVARDQVKTHISSRGIVSNSTYGRVQPKSWFYGSKCKEIIVEQPFDDAIEQIFSRHYSEWESIRIIEHPFTSFDYQLANGKPRASGEYGLVVIKIDLALMYTQYRAWREDTLRSTYSDGTMKSIKNFIHSYPIVNLLKTHLDRVWFNRFINRYSGYSVSNNREDTRHFLGNSYYNVDEIHDKWIDDIDKSRGANFLEICTWIPGLFCKNLKEHLTQDNILKTQQIKLSWELGRLRFLSWLFQTEFKNKTNSNGMYRNEYLREFSIYKNSRSFGTINHLKNEEVQEWFETRINSFID